MIVKKEFEIPIYNNNRLCIIFADSVEEVEKATGIFVEGFKNILGCVINSYNKKDKKTIYIIFNTSNKDEINTGVLVHECVHATNRIFFNIYHNPERDNDENQAYLTEYIFNEVEKVYKKYKDEHN